ncbi:MAG: S41 family peptidase [Planctomycetota bacterium]|nr:MAG: S41 family peptidase [Planctomycetota bacterium]
MFFTSALSTALTASALQAGMPQSPEEGARAVPPATEGAYRWLDPIIDLRALIVGSYVESIDSTAMQRAAMEAMTKALGDPYTVYIPPADERAFRTQMSGSYVGIGVELDLDDGRPLVITAIDGSPAMEAGILPGDTILSVDGKSTEGVGAATLESLLPGAPGTVAALVIRRADGNERTLNVPRRVVETPIVKGILRDADGWRFSIDQDRRMAYIRIAQFNDRTLAELDAALARIRADGVSGIVLDLRDNGGGALTAAVGVVDRFLSAGAIVSIRGRGDVGRTWDATATPEDLHVPLVVLVNQGSASASEIVAGALRDNGCAKIIGTRSYGKGSVQDILQLPDGAGTVKITTARYYLPSGASPHRTAGAAKWGVEPDTGFRVPMTEQESIASVAARQARETRGANNAPPVMWNSSASIRTVAHDPQLAAAVDALQGYLDMVEWPVVGDLSGDVGAGNDELRSSIEYRRRLLDELHRTDQTISTLRRSGAGVDDPLLANDASLIDGAMELRDRDGHVVGRWIIKDPSALRNGIGAGAIPAPEYTPAREVEGK